MNGVLTLQGRLKAPDGQPIPNLILAIVDEDMLDEDDLLGIGTTDDAGGFRLSFAQSEFQQDSLESEETPDIKIIVSLVAGDSIKPIFTRSFSDLAWAGGREDLGDITVDNFDLNKPVYLDGIEAIPGSEKRAKRLNIDNEMIRACFAEIVPLVEFHTGWSDLARDIKIEVVDSLAPHMLREMFKEKGIAEGSMDARFTEIFMDSCAGYGAGGGLYDPSTHTIYINRTSMEQNGIELLKIILAHELTHAGQFLTTPGLAAYARDYNRRMLGLVPGSTPEDMKARRIYMVELEGYATYIERDFIRKNYYRMAVTDYHSSVFDKIVQTLAALAASATSEAQPAPEASMDDKFNQYEQGVALYRSRAAPDAPARFVLKVEDLPGGAAFAAA